MKRSRAFSTSPSESESNCTEYKKRTVVYSTYLKWSRDFDREYQTLSWLECDTTFAGGHKIVTHLRCSVCTKFESYIKSGRNYSSKWIYGADSLRTSNIRDHARSDQHVHALNLLRRESSRTQGQSFLQSTVIGKALSSLSESEKAKLRCKFDVAFFIAKEKLSFKKYPQLLKLEARHGISLGTTYMSEVSCREFTHYIAECMRQHITNCTSTSNFFSLLLDGSTDSGNIENIAFFIVWLDKNGIDEKIVTKSSFYQVCKPSNVNGEGLLSMVESVLKMLGLKELDSEYCTKLVGFGTDGASANIAGLGLKGLIEKQLPWIYWMWCLAHRLELSVKDAFKNSSFDLIDDMLVKLYYLYEKSPKKCRQLEDIVSDLRGCFTVDSSGVRPIRASGSRWIAHKWHAMKRVLSRYGVYTMHLAALSEDNAVRPADRAKVKGYHCKWTDAKYVLGCALFIDLLGPCAILSKNMQNNDLDILAALTGLLKSVSEINKLKSMSLSEWPTYSATIEKCENETYQGQKLKRFSVVTAYYESNYTAYCEKLLSCTRTRLMWSDIEFLRDIIFVLASQGWQKALDEKHDLKAVDRLAVHFAVPLEASGVTVQEIHSEFEEILNYAVQYISLATLEYRAVWWRVFHAPNASEWHNALLLIELLFSLPASNGKVEQAFSQLNIIKSDKRTQLSNESLNDLMTISTSGQTIEDFNPDPAIELWWKDKVRRPNQKPRKLYKHRQQDDSSSSDSDSDSLILDTWDKWMDPDSDS